jgi:hypothetical protein
MTKQEQAKEHYEQSLTCIDNPNRAFLITTVKESKEGYTVSLIWQGNYRQLAKIFANILMQEFESNEEKNEFVAAVALIIQKYQESKEKVATA